VREIDELLESLNEAERMAREIEEGRLAMKAKQEQEETRLEKEKTRLEEEKTKVEKDQTKVEKEQTMLEEEKA
jgi:hypothetical protein